MPDQSVQDFYQDRRKRGMSNAMIVNELEAGGWDRNQADAAIQAMSGLGNEDDLLENMQQDIRVAVLTTPQQLDKVVGIIAAHEKRLSAYISLLLGLSFVLGDNPFEVWPDDLGIIGGGIAFGVVLWLNLYAKGKEKRAYTLYDNTAAAHGIPMQWQHFRYATTANLFIAQLLFFAMSNLVSPWAWVLYFLGIFYAPLIVNRILFSHTKKLRAIVHEPAQQLILQKSSLEVLRDNPKALRPMIIIFGVLIVVTMVALVFLR